MILTSCDEFSRTHLASEGVDLAPMEPPTIDPYEVSREAAGPEGQRQEHSTKDTYDNLQQFLHHDRKVLRYFAHSETPFTPLGKTYKKKFVICFFLSDNSLEVSSNPGRQCFCPRCATCGTTRSQKEPEPFPNSSKGSDFRRSGISFHLEGNSYQRHLLGVPTLTPSLP